MIGCEQARLRRIGHVQISCAHCPKVRSRYTLLVAPGQLGPSHTRPILRPAASANPGSPGMWAG